LPSVTELKNKKEICVLYVDDEEPNLKAFNANFRREFNIHTAISAEEGLKVLRENEIHIVITDQRMPVKTGIEFLEDVITEYPDVMRMLLTGYTDIEAVIDAINIGKVYNYISKPWNADTLRNMILRAYEVYHLREEVERLNKKLLKVNKQLEFMLRQKLIS